jgi:hypothetical protein
MLALVFWVVILGLIAISAGVGFVGFVGYRKRQKRIAEGDAAFVRMQTIHRLIERVPTEDRMWLRWHWDLGVNEDHPNRPRPYPFRDV